MMLLTINCVAAESWGEMIFSRHPSAVEGDSRHVWYDRVLTLALEKTRGEFGAYRLAQLPKMPTARTWEAIRTNRYPNLLFAVPYEKSLASRDDLAYVDFPLQLGLLGYRVCLTAESRKSYIYEQIQKGQLHQLTIGQASSWADVPILQANHFHVMQVDNYGYLFRMVAAKRFDLLCRGVNEVYDEFTYHGKNLSLYLDSKFALHYPFPVFFFTNSANTHALARVQQGLERAYSDGSLIALFEAYYAERLRFVKMQQREIIRLYNPLTAGLDDSYKTFNYPVVGGVKTENGG